MKSSNDEQLENLRKELENERISKNELTGKMEILIEENLKLQGVINGNYPVINFHFDCKLLGIKLYVKYVYVP